MIFSRQGGELWRRGGNNGTAGERIGWVETVCVAVNTPIGYCGSFSSLFEGYGVEARGRQELYVSVGDGITYSCKSSLWFLEIIELLYGECVVTVTVWWVTLAMSLPSKAVMFFGLDRVSRGRLSCLTSSSLMKLKFWNQWGLAGEGNPFPRGDRKELRSEWKSWG